MKTKSKPDFFKDKYGDLIEVGQTDDNDAVYVEFELYGENASVTMHLTPIQALEIVEAVKKHAATVMETSDG